MNKNRIIVLLAALIVAAAVGGTIAYLMDITDPLTNTFTPTEVDVDITDKIDENFKKEVVITNTGTTSAYIRARIVGNWVDESGVVVRPWDPAGDGTFTGLPGTNWVQNGDYYYYTLPVAPGGVTERLFTSYKVNKTDAEADLVVDILVQAVQSEGGAVQDAWGWTPTSSSP